jgi:predicted Zn finger-like uncharacterized protein
MQIVCPGCGQHLQIADDKLPAERVRLTCPACQERFAFAPQGTKPSNGSPPHMGVEPPAQTPTASLATRTSSTGTGVIIDFAELGPPPRALVCLDDASHRQECEGMLPSLGYKTIHMMPHQVQALAYLSQVAYECIFLDATFDGSTLEANPILACLLELPMDRRRYMFVTLCAPDTVAKESLTAYSHSVHLVIDQTDIPTCRRTLEQYLAEHKRLYRIYRELRQQLGKDV